MKILFIFILFMVFVSCTDKKCVYLVTFPDGTKKEIIAQIPKAKICHIGDSGTLSSHENGRKEILVCPFCIFEFIREEEIKD